MPQPDEHQQHEAEGLHHALSWAPARGRAMSMIGLRQHEAGEQPERQLDEEVAGIVGVGEGFERAQRRHHEVRAADQRRTAPRAPARAARRAAPAGARVRSPIVPRERVGGEMGVGARRRRECHRDVKREQPLAEIVRLARPAADECRAAAIAETAAATTGSSSQRPPDRIAATSRSRPPIRRVMLN